ncbi:MAG: hypothetical protein U1A78_25490 [Polyangia bacterium]
MSPLAIGPVLRSLALPVRLGPGLAFFAALAAGSAGCSRGGSEVVKMEPDPADLGVAQSDLAGADLGGRSDLGAPPECAAPCWLNPLPQGNHLMSLWRDKSGDGWAVGFGPSFVRIESGGRVRVVRTALSEQQPFFYQVWGSGPGDVWAVGQNLIMHYDGTAWTQSALDTGGYLGLRGVWGSGAASPRDVWAVGTGGAIRRFDGTTWQKVTSPATKDLNSVHGTSDKHAVAVGAGGTILRWDGSSWKAETLALFRDLTHVRCAAANDCLAVGESGTAARFDGTRWTEIKTGLYDTFHGLVALGPADYFVTGSSISGPATYRFDGKTFKPGSTDGLYLYALDGTSATELWASGPDGTLASWNGLSWTPRTSGTQENLTAVFALSPSELWAAGMGRSTVTPSTPPHLVRWDGARMTAFDAPGRAVFQALWGSGSKDVWAVGSQGAMAHWDGGSWSLLPKLTTEELLAVHGSGPAQVFAAGSRGVMLRYDGKVWATVTSPVAMTDSVFGLWVTASDGWAVGGSGTTGVLARFDGSKWTAWPKRFNKLLKAVWGSGPRDVWAGGSDGLLLHFDGTDWSEVSSPVTQDVEALAGSGAGDVWLSAYGGIVHRFDGTSWRAVFTDTRHNLTGLARIGGHTLAVGASGAVLRLAP